MNLSFFGRLGAYITLLGVLGIAAVRYLAEPEPYPYAYEREDGRYFVLFVLTLLGLVMLMRSLAAQLREDDFWKGRAASLNLPPDRGGQSVISGPLLSLAEIRNLTSLRQRRKPLEKLSLRTSYFGLLCALALGPICMFYYTFHGRTPYGLRVYLSQPAKFWPGQAWKNRLLVQVDSQGHWYLNSQPINDPYHEKQIRELVAHRAGRLVFLAVDTDAPYQTAIHAIEALQQAWNARVVLVTGDMLEQAEPKQTARNPPRSRQVVPQTRIR